MFDSLRLSIVVAAEITTEILTEVLAEVLTEVIAEVKARVKIRQPEELEVFNSLRLSIVLLIAVHY